MLLAEFKQESVTGRVSGVLLLIEGRFHLLREWLVGNQDSMNMREVHVRNKKRQRPQCDSNSNLR